MRVLLTGGGTGGHLYPGLAIVEALEKRTECRVMYVGTKRGVETRVIPQTGYDFKTVWISGIQRNRLMGNLLFPLKMGVSLIQAIFITTRFRPDVVIGTGGYVSWPVMMAGILLKKKTVLQEQNEWPGLVTRTLSSRVHRVYLTFDATRAHLKAGANPVVLGNPTRASLDEGARNQGVKRYGLDPKKKTVFVFGGSQGSKALNEAVLASLDALMKRDDVQILWATGPRWYEEIAGQTQALNQRVKAVPYIQEMGAAYRTADLLVCRAGATTVAEIARIGLPVIFVPLPTSAEGHQEANARVLEKAGAAEVVLEGASFHKRLIDSILTLLIDNDRRDQMAKQVCQFGRPQAAADIADDILTLTAKDKG